MGAKAADAKRRAIEELEEEEDPKAAPPEDEEDPDEDAEEDGDASEEEGESPEEQAEEEAVEEAEEAAAAKKRVKKAADTEADDEEKPDADAVAVISEEDLLKGIADRVAEAIPDIAEIVAKALKPVLRRVDAVQKALDEVIEGQETLAKGVLGTKKLVKALQGEADETAKTTVAKQDTKPTSEAKPLEKSVEVAGATGGMTLGKLTTEQTAEFQGLLKSLPAEQKPSSVLYAINTGNVNEGHLEMLRKAAAPPEGAA